MAGDDVTKAVEQFTAQCGEEWQALPMQESGE